jgi:hypothetical protein
LKKTSRSSGSSLLKKRARFLRQAVAAANDTEQTLDHITLLSAKNNLGRCSKHDKGGV